MDGKNDDVFVEKDWYKSNITDLLKNIDDVWILKSIFNFIKGMIKEG